MNERSRGEAFERGLFIPSTRGDALDVVVDGVMATLAQPSRGEAFERGLFIPSTRGDAFMIVTDGALLRAEVVVGDHPRLARLFTGGFPQNRRN